MKRLKLAAALGIILWAEAASAETATARQVETGRERIAEVRGLSLAYESVGPRDGDALLLIAGTGMQLTDWPSGLVDGLVARGYRVVAYDHRDVGHSSKLDAAGAPDWPAVFAALGAGKRPPLAYTLEDLAADAVGLLDVLGIRRAHLVGVSMGGMIAQVVASKYPERVISLTSIMAGAGNPARPVPARPEVMAQVPPAAKAGDLDRIVAREMKLWRALGSPAYPLDEGTLRARVEAAVKRSYDPAGLERQGAAAVSAGDRRAELASVRAPTVVVQGAEDPIIALEGARDVAGSIPGAELRIVPGMGHDLPDPLVPTVVDAIVAVAARGRLADESRSR